MLSWQKTGKQPPSVQHFVFDQTLGGANPHLFLRCALWINGYGCQQSFTSGLHDLITAADRGHLLSQAVCCRVWGALRATPGAETVSEKSVGKQWLKHYAERGSRIAKEELLDILPSDPSKIFYRLLGDAWGGVGAPWLTPGQMLHGYTQSQWIKDEWFLERVEGIVGPVTSFMVNKRGDTVLHLAAMTGCVKPFIALIEQYKMDVNLRNAQGETPLLCASRAGQGGVVAWCLDKYHADASIAALNGETALHWVNAFQAADMPKAIRSMLAQGATVDALTTADVDHSMYPSGMDIENHPQGTPLLWAVHEDRPDTVKQLLQHGADPFRRHEYATWSPLEAAAYFHRAECLESILTHLKTDRPETFSESSIEDRRKSPYFGSWVYQCVHAADKFSMMIRSGAKYLERLHATLDFLRKETKLVPFETHFAGSLLHYAVCEGYDDVTEYMFRHGWLIDKVNLPCRADGRTALLEAVRWNRPRIARLPLEHDADVSALARNPFQPIAYNWSALHTFALEGHEGDMSLVDELIKGGVPVDGYTNAPRTYHNAKDDTNPQLATLSLGESPSILPCETSFAVALRRNAFQLATKLLLFGADPNALCQSSGLVVSLYPQTVLGHIVMANARYSSARLQFLLKLNVNFVVEPRRQLTALHRAAMAHRDNFKITAEQVSRSEFDFSTAIDILDELLAKWSSQEQLDAKCGINGNTSLHLAMESENLDAVHKLMRAGADARIRNERGESSAEMAVRKGIGKRVTLRASTD